MSVTWSPPSHPNGIIERYELVYKTVCPLPPQPFNNSKTCTVHGPTTVYTGLDQQYQVTGLDPYMEYDVRVNAFNSIGGADVAPWSRARTRTSLPLYLVPFKLSLVRASVVIDWSDTFRLNGYLTEYVLYADSRRTYNGFGTQASLERQTKEQKIVFFIKCITRSGIAETPNITFDPKAPGYIAPTSGPTVGKQTETLPVYQEVWFIAVVTLVALLTLMLGIALCLRRGNTKVPYVRERQPLTPRQRKRELEDIGYCIPPYDASNITGSIPHPASNYSNNSIKLTNGMGFNNQAYNLTHSSLHGSTAGSARGSITDVSFQGKSSNWDEDDFDILAPTNDSGLQSMAGHFDESDDFDSTHHYSFNQDHTIFTDTHL